MASPGPIRHDLIDRDPVRPGLSVLMPVRDADRYLDESLDSLAAQQFGDYEAVVVDDGSTDASAERVAARAARDRRIRLLRRPARGIVAALNDGLGQCRAPVVVRMDADDRMHPQRLGQLARAFQRQPGTALIGSAVRASPASAAGAGMREYLRWQNALLTPAAIAADIYWEAPFAHPSVAFRRDAVLALGGYAEGPFPEDYDLWLRMHGAGRRMSKLSAALLDWRLHPDSLSRRDPRYARSAFDTLRARYLAPRLAALAPREVVVWGAGRRTRKRAGALERAGVRVSAWIDIDPRKIGRAPGGIPVHPPAWLHRRPRRPVVLAYVAAHGARERIGAALDFMGYVRGQDYWPVG